MKPVGYFLFLLAFLIILSACSPTPEVVEVEVEVTATPTPPISALDLVPLIVQPGDLPAGYSAAQVRDTAPDMYNGLPAAEKTIFQQFAHNDAPARGVAIFLYPAPADRETAYALILDGMGDDTPSITFGEKAAGSAVDIYGTKITEMVFIRCIAVIHISFSDLQDLDAITAYAKRLDERLTPIICQYP